MNILSLRAGYRLNVDEQDISLGAGVVTSIDVVSLALDYGYSAFGRLGGVHRLTLGVRP
jgi:hypothetical protein